MSEQVVVDSLEFARNAGTVSGQVAVAKLLRLADVLHSDAGSLEYSLTGGMTQHGKPVLHCQVKGTLQLRCQRCLEALAYELDSRSDLILARDEAELARLDEQDEEASDAILAEPRLDVLALVEDEVLLDLPMAPRHAAGACQAKGTEDRDAEEQHPFAGLAALKPKPAGD